MELSVEIGDARSNAGSSKPSSRRPCSGLERPDRGSRSARALAASVARPGQPRRVHPAARAQRRHRVDLDLAIFEQCCRFLRDRLDKGAVIVPLNCNFSRLHFLVDDSFATR